MYNVENSPVTAPKRPTTQLLYPPTVLNDFIKCVVVGDSGVGKTCLITAWACDTEYTLQQLVKTHVSTVWAHDHYRNDKNILERSVVEIDGGYVSLRLWDTFGYHDKDRGFAYRGADVVLLCYSVAMPRSYNDLRKIWIPEIKRRAPSTPVVIVGCQADLRYLYRHETYQKVHKGLMYRVVEEKDIITPDQGRAVAREIGAPYYECSVLNKYGVEEVFLNVIRAGVVEKRKIKFWNSQLRRVKYPQLQVPMKLPPLLLSTIEVPKESLHDDLCKLIDNQSEGEVVFDVQGQCFRAHKICLVISAKIFHILFMQSLQVVIDLEVKKKKTVSLKRSSSSHSNTAMFTDACTLIDNDFLISTSTSRTSEDDSNFSQTFNPSSLCPAIISMEESKTWEDPFKPGEVVKQTVIRLNDEITPRAFQYVLKYLYTGVVVEDYDAFKEVKVACRLFQLSDLALMISNLESNEPFLNVELENRFREDRKRNLRDIALNRELFSDVKFQVDDGVVKAHKPLLIARCEMMYAMFNANFLEASAEMISLPGISKDIFLAIREFLYTGECPVSATLNCLGIIEVANRLCLPRLVTLVEAQVIEDLTNEDKDGVDIIEDVLTLLEPAKLHNAAKLTDWCMKYLCNRYLILKQKYCKPFHKLLSPESVKFIERNRWPPEWYIRELNYYDNAQSLSLKSKKSKGSIQQKSQFSRRDQCVSAARCFCFCRRSKIVIEDFDSIEMPQ